MASYKRRKRSWWRRLKASTRRRAILIGALLAIGTYAMIFYAYIASPYLLKWHARYGEIDIPEGYSIHGIDISHHQGDIDWDELSKAQIGNYPISFVFMKATEGTTFTDKNFTDNFYQAREHGMLRGAYHYYKPNRSAREQAQFFIRQVALESGDLPPVLDVEENGELTTAELQNAVLTWLRVVENVYGCRPIIYTSYKFKKKYLSSHDFDIYPYWIAHYYQPHLRYDGVWKFWQHTDSGRLPGIKEKVDLNIYNGSMYDLKKLTLPRTTD